MSERRVLRIVRFVAHLYANLVGPVRHGIGLPRIGGLVGLFLQLAPVGVAASAERDRIAHLVAVGILGLPGHVHLGGAGRFLCGLVLLRGRDDLDGLEPGRLIAGEIGDLDVVNRRRHTWDRGFEFHAASDEPCPRRGHHLSADAKRYAPFTPACVGLRDVARLRDELDACAGRELTAPRDGAEPCGELRVEHLTREEPLLDVTGRVADHPPRVGRPRRRRLLRAPSPGQRRRDSPRFE